MRYNSRLSLALASATWLVAAPSISSAQTFLSDRAASEGPGFRVGRLELHPGVSTQFGWDSNVFLADDDREDSMILRVTGHLDISTVGAQRRAQGDSGQADQPKIDFRAGIAGAYYHWFFDRLRDNASADAYANLDWNPSQAFTLRVRELFRRTVQPFANANTATGDATSFGLNYNSAGLDLIMNSRGNVLQGRLGYTNEFQFFDSVFYEYGDNLTHRAQAGLSWAFFPTSALVYEFDFAFQDFVNPDQVAVSPVELSNNRRINNRIGYNGALTQKLSITALIGYTVGFYDELDDFDAVTARAEARWRPRPTVLVSGGFDRDVLPSFIGNFTTMNRLFANAELTLGGAGILGIRTWVSFDKSGLALAPDGTPVGTELDRTDIRVSATVYGEYRVRAWLAFFAEVGYLADFTDFDYLGNFGPLIDPSGRYQRVQTWVGVRVFY